MNLRYIALFALPFLAISCKKDNYDAPSSTLAGRIVYNGEAVPVEMTQVFLELWQPGFGKSAPIRVAIDQDGSYSSLLFDGDYKLTLPNGQGPYLWRKNSAGAPDTVAVKVNGDQTLDIEVMPYYMIRSHQFSPSGANVSATFGLEKIIADASARNIEHVNLYINKTAIVSGAANIASTRLDAASIPDMSSISLSVAVPAMVPTQSYVFARIGVKIEGVEDMLLSPIQKVEL